MKVEKSLVWESNREAGLEGRSRLFGGSAVLTSSGVWGGGMAVPNVSCRRFCRHCESLLMHMSYVLRVFKIATMHIHAVARPASQQPGGFPYMDPRPGGRLERYSSLIISAC